MFSYGFLVYENRFVICFYFCWKIGSAVDCSIHRMRDGVNCVVCIYKTKIKIIASCVPHIFAKYIYVQSNNSKNK